MASARGLAALDESRGRGQHSVLAATQRVNPNASEIVWEQAEITRPTLLLARGGYTESSVRRH